ncbi:hypothetical protein [Anatilimnocola aggregata]|nr:hypothetical protein [Anatilimnocola aggregata]
MSTAVRIHLQVDGLRLRVSQVGENSLILREPEQLEAGNAQLIISVDGDEIVHPIHLTDGIAGRTVFFKDLDTCPADAEFRNTGNSADHIVPF